MTRSLSPGSGGKNDSSRSGVSRSVSRSRAEKMPSPNSGGSTSSNGRNNGDAVGKNVSMSRARSLSPPEVSIAHGGGTTSTPKGGIASQSLRRRGSSSSSDALRDGDDPSSSQPQPTGVRSTAGRPKTPAAREKRLAAAQKRHSDSNTALLVASALLAGSTDAESKDAGTGPPASPHGLMNSPPPSAEKKKKGKSTSFALPTDSRDTR